MREKSKRYILCAVVLLLLGIGECAAEFFTTLKLPRVTDGQLVCLIDSDTGDILDSIPAMKETVVFRSDCYKPCVVDVDVDGQAYGNFILSDAQITLDVEVEDIYGGIFKKWNASGGYNDSITVILQQVVDIRENLQRAETDQAQDSIKDSIIAFLLDKIATNADNILGYKLFLMSKAVLPLDSIENLLDRYPALKGYKQINEVVSKEKTLRATQPGARFRDFTISYEGTQHKLSDVVGKGDYVLLDFWAFWCMPCREEMPYIKDVYNRFKSKNFKVIGIAISDNPAMDLKIAAELELPWEIWVNGSDASEAYSVASIPHLILFGPDGTILERGIRGNDILPVVAKYLEVSD